MLQKQRRVAMPLGWKGLHPDSLEHRRPDDAHRDISITQSKRITMMQLGVGFDLGAIDESTITRAEILQQDLATVRLEHDVTAADTRIVNRDVAVPAATDRQLSFS